MKIERLENGTVRFIVNEAYANQYNLTFSDVLNYRPVTESFYTDMYEEAEARYGVTITRNLLDYGVGYCKLDEEDCLCIEVETSHVGAV